jgi:hypothetical protein
MKSFDEIVKESNLIDRSLNEYIKLNESDFEYLNESEKQEVQDILVRFGDKKIQDLDEGLLGNILGGLTGFVVGPAIGKVIANAIGIDKGIMYDMLTSRLVGIALGSAISKYMSGK